MNNTDMPGDDIIAKHHSPGDPGFGPLPCQAACDALPACKSWTWVVRGRPAGSGDCCLHADVNCPRVAHGMTSGAKLAGDVPCGAPPGPPGPHPSSGVQAQLERGQGGWWGTQQANGRMMMIGWALPDYHGAAGPGIGTSFLFVLSCLVSYRVSDLCVYMLRLSCALLLVALFLFLLASFCLPFLGFA
jgi:hypothetical protein